MAHSAIFQRRSLPRQVSGLAVVLVAVVALMFTATNRAAATPLVGKDGKIHACYKVKGKAQGTLRVVRSAKARCPRKWKKVAWNASGPGGSSGFQGEAGAPGPSGQNGPRGESGPPGTAGNVVVKGLEEKVTELLARVQSLESVLGAVCTQAKDLNEQSTELGDSLEALNTVLEPLLVLFSPVSVPTALPPFTCPAL